MDKLTIISGILFLVADVFSLVSLSMPDWIVSDVGGITRLGLMCTCEAIGNRPEVCYSVTPGGAWFVASLCILFGSSCVSLTIIFLLMSYCHCAISLNLMSSARWFGFTAMVLFCLAAVIIPIGFSADEIGGEPYQLPLSFQVGNSYILFVLALWMTVISELFAGKVCLPHF